MTIAELKKSHVSNKSRIALNFKQGGKGGRGRGGGLAGWTGERKTSLAGTEYRLSQLS